MLFPFKLLPFSLPFSLWPLFGVITGIICFELNYLIHIFSLISLCFLLFVLIKKNISFGLILFICGAVLGATRIAFLKKNYSYPSFNLAQASLHVKEIIKTGNAHWPYRITLRKAAYPYHSFFLFCKRKPESKIEDLISCPNLYLTQPKDSDFLRYLFKEGSAGTIFAQEFCPILINSKKYSFARWAHNKREAVISSLKQKLSRPTFSFFCSLFIGDKKQINYLTEKHKPLFKQWGISHHMARSGVHLIIFIILWQLLLSLLPFSFIQKHSFLFILCLFYFLLTPASISFIRAFFLFVFYKICIFCSWQIHAVHLLCLVALGTLVYNPFQLFFLDFQLSFFLTFCLSWVSHLNRQRQTLF